MRGAAVAGLLAIVVLVGAGAGYLTGNTNQKTITSTTTKALVLTSTLTTTLVLSSAITTTRTLTLQSSPTNATEVCVSNIANPPQSQYVAMLHQIILIPSFIQYSNGRCWTWDSTFELSGPGSSSLNFVFDHYTSKINYPCGLFPAYEVDTRVYVVPTFSNGNVASVSIQAQPLPLIAFCPAITPTIQPISFNLMSWNSSGQTVSLKLAYYPTGNASIRSMEARIFNSSWSYLMPFIRVNSTNLLLPGLSVSQETLIPGAPLRSNVVYGMTVIGTYVNGTKVVSNFKVQLQM